MINFFKLLVRLLIWFLCFLLASVVIFSFSNLEYIPLEIMLNKIFKNNIFLNGIQLIFIAFIIKMLFMKLYRKFIKPKLDKLKKESREAIKTRGKELKIQIMKIKKGHIITLITDTVIVLLLALVTIVEEIFSTDFITAALAEMKIPKENIIGILSGTLILTMFGQYKTTLANAKKEDNQTEKEVTVKEEVSPISKIFKEMTEIFIQKDEND